MYDDIERMKIDLNNRDQYDRRNTLIGRLKDVPIMPARPKHEDKKKIHYICSK